MSNLNKYFIISGMLSTFYKYYLDISSQETISTFNLQVSYVFNNFSIKDYKFSAFIHSETIEYLNYEFQIPFISCSIIDAMYADFDGEGWNIPLSIIGNKDYETISFIDFHSNDSEDPIFLYTSSSPFPFNTYEFANVTLPIGTIPE